MQLSQQGEMEKSQISQPRHKNLYLDGNIISWIGCKHLSHGNWDALTTLNLGTASNIYLVHNNISDIGCKCLSQGKWQHL